MSYPIPTRIMRSDDRGQRTDDRRTRNTVVCYTSVHRHLVPFLTSDFCRLSSEPTALAFKIVSARTKSLRVVTLRFHGSPRMMWTGNHAASTMDASSG